MGLNVLTTHWIVAWGVVLLVGVLRVARVEGSTTLTTSESSSVIGVEHFGTDLECRVSTCLKNKDKLEWYKGTELIARGLQILNGDARYKIRHNVFLNHTQDCSGSCDDDGSCQEGKHCLDVICCQCSGEEFTLVIAGMNATDSSAYKCKYNDASADVHAELDYDLDVIASGLEVGWHKNFTYDHTDCCRKNGVPPECMGPCNVGKLSLANFDPMKCEGYMQGFLQCVTEDGNVSHMYCCRQEFVPPFCWDFCSGTADGLRSSHRLCIYWLTEILSCYERAYLPFPSEPLELTVVSRSTNGLDACWQPPSDPDGTILNYTVHYKEVPRLPFLGSGIPFLPIDDGASSLPPWEQGNEPAIPPPPPGHLSGFNQFLNIVPDQPQSSQRSHRVPRGYEMETFFPGASVEVIHSAKYRQKRDGQIFIFSSVPGFGTLNNDSDAEQMRYETVNTTQTCFTIPGLRPSTEYSVFVTATNEYGSSLPSIRSIAATQAEFLSIGHGDGTVPNVKQCCQKNNVSSVCIPKVCDLERSPSAVGAFDIALTCRSEFVRVSPCLADGRDHTPCCRSRGVRDACLKLCNGSATYIGFDSIFCLTMDLNTVFTCLKEGYETHPSPPANVTLFDITAISATISWLPPLIKPENVQNYSIFYKEDNFLEPYQEIRNARSPHMLLDLKPGTPYLAYVIAHGIHGNSLQSSIEGFFTEPETDHICDFGMPLLNDHGEIVRCRYPPRPGEPSCPRHFQCILGRLDGGETYCCPDGEVLIEPPGFPPSATMSPEINVQQCCQRHNVTPVCAELCSYDTQVQDLVGKGPQCFRYVEDWVTCAADGRDHRPCCAESGVPLECQIFCYPDLPPLNETHISCVAYVDDILTCGRVGILKLPGPALNLRVTKLGHGQASLAWDPPQQPIPIDRYDVRVYLRGQTKPVKQYNSTIRSLAVNELKPDEEYVINVLSHNMHGSSIPSNNVTFTIPDIDIATEPNADNKPTAPFNFVVASYRDNSVHLTWDWDGKSESGKTLTGVISYVVEYKLEFPMSGAEFETHSLTTADKSAVVDNLSIGQQYNMWVSVKHELDGKSYLGHSSYTITVVPEEGHSGVELELTFEPAKTSYRENDSLVITCSAFGNPAPKLVLSKNHEFQLFHEPPLATGTGQLKYTLKRVDWSMHDGVVKCATDTNDPARQIFSVRRLIVEFQPRLVPVKTDRLSVIDGDPVSMKIKVFSYPMPTVRWYYVGRDGARKGIEREGRHNLMVDHTDQGPDVYIASLSLNETKLTDDGLYVCEVTNELGSMSWNVTLTVNAKAGAPDPLKIQGCCEKAGVSRDCLGACGSGIDISEYDSDRCANDFEKVLKCGLDGNDHSGCCAERGVPSACLHLCAGTLDDTDWSRSPVAMAPPTSPLECADHAKIVLYCYQERQASSLEAPINVRLQPVGKGMVRVTWDVTSDTQNELVEKFFVYYKQEGKYDWETQSVAKTPEKSTYSTVLSQLHPDVNYNVSVAAVSGLGFSPFSQPQLIRVSSGASGDIDAAGTESGEPDAAGPGKSETRKQSIGGKGKGALVGCIVVGLLLIIIAAALVMWYRSRRRSAHGSAASRIPSRLPSVFGRGGPPRGTQPLGEVVSFENPSYGGDGKVHGLPGDGDSEVGGRANGAGTSLGPDETGGGGNTGWQSPSLETPTSEDAAFADLGTHSAASPNSNQKGMKYAQLT